MFKRLCYLPALRLKMFDGGNQGKWCIQCQSQVSKISCRPNEQPETFHACCYLCQIYFTIYDWLIKKFRTSTSHCLSWLLNRPPLFITDEQMHGYCFGFYLLTPVYYPILVVVCLSLHHFWLWLIFAAPEIKCTGCRGPRDHWILPIYSETSGKIILLTSYLWVIPLWLWTETILAGQMLLR